MSITLSMPNARFRDRSRDGRTAADTSAESASNPVTTERWSHSGSVGAIASHMREGATTMRPKTLSHAVRTIR